MLQTSGWTTNGQQKLLAVITLPTMAQLITWQACHAEGISFLIWEAGAPNRKEKKTGQHIKTTEHELSHSVKVRKSNLACEIPISYSTMTTGSNHGRTLQWASQAILQSDRHVQHKMIRPWLYFHNYKNTIVDTVCFKPHSWGWQSKRNLLNNRQILQNATYFTVTIYVF